MLPVTIVDSVKLKRHVSRSLLTAVLSHTVMASRAVIASEVSPLRSLSQRFNPVTPVLPQHVVVTSGVGPAPELCGFAFCDPGDGIQKKKKKKKKKKKILGRPFSGSLPSDLGLRAK